MPKIVDHDEHRKVLLKTCFDLFGRKGFSNVTMREIAREAGVSTGALYHYFPTKEDVLKQMFAWAVEDDIEAYGRHTSRYVPTEERPGRLAEFWLGKESYYQNLLLLALDLFRNSPSESERVFQDYIDHYRAAVTNILGTSSRLSEFMITYLLGLMVQSVLTRRSFASAGHAAFMRQVLASLLASDANGRKAGRHRKTVVTGPRQTAGRRGRATAAPPFAE